MRTSNADKDYIYERDLGICYICGRRVKRNKMTLDHYFPKSLGGSSEIFNLVCCCKQCNRLKRSQMPNDWVAVNISLFRRAIIDKRLNTTALTMSVDALLTKAERINSIFLNRFNAVFEAPGVRFYVKDGAIKKVVHFDELDTQNIKI